MQPSNQQQMVSGGGFYPVVTSTPLSAQSASNGKLWGSSVRRAMGIIQVICGTIQFILNIVVMCLPLSNFSFAYFGWGIWNGVFAVITGFLGIYSRRIKGVVIAYMVMSIIASLLSAFCCLATGWIIPYAAYRRAYSGYYDYDRYEDTHQDKIEKAHLAIYIILAVAFFLQMLFSIIGSSFTCGALTSNNNPQRIVYRLNAYPDHPFGPAPPYTSLDTQIQPGRVGQVNPSYGQQTTFVSGSNATPTNAAVVAGNGANMMGSTQTKPRYSA